MRLISLAAAAAVLVLAGCASNDGLVPVQAPTVVAAANTDVTPKSKVVCHKETSMGSNMIHSVCETEQSEADRQNMQNQLLNNGALNGANQRAAGTGH